MHGELGDSFLAETRAQMELWREINRRCEDEECDVRNSSITVITDSQSTLRSINSTNPNHAATVALQRELAHVPMRVTHRWIPAHCGFGPHDAVDELAREAAEKVEGRVSTLAETWKEKLRKKRPRGGQAFNIRLELHTAKRFLRQEAKKAQREEWMKMGTKLAETLMVDEEGDVCLPRVKTFTHPNARVASRVNRLRTQRTLFHRKKWVPNLCEMCDHVNMEQCVICVEKLRGGHWRFEPRECDCKEMGTGRKSKLTLKHMLEECSASRSIVDRRRKLNNFHAITGEHGSAEAMDVAARAGAMRRVAWDSSIGRGRH